MLHARSPLRRAGRFRILTMALGLALASTATVAIPALATGANSSPQPISNADANPGGANGQCPGGPYCSTRDGSASGNGNGNGASVGKPCAGCVGKADNKNPPGQMPNGTDHNAGYECDRNHGIGRSNPAHTGCTSVNPPPVIVPPIVPPVVEPVVEPPVEPPVVEPPVVEPPVVEPPVVEPPVVEPVFVPVVVPTLSPPVASPPVAPRAVNPLPVSAAAGEANTNGQLLAGGFAGLAAFIAMGAGVVMRRRHGDA